MCPSYRATKDERHSTRGRSRLLFEMLDGHLGDDGWRSDDVHEALDLCLGCKACSSECPVSVDMATYKAEFLDHHYRGRLRPRSHYSMGWLPLWLRFARRMPRLANLMLRSKTLARLGGIEPRRLARLGVDLTSVDEGCCGLAGNFGFEPGHYDVSVTYAEQSFLPVLREHPSSEVLADGFSCRLQIEQLGERKPLHLAQLLRRQLRTTAASAALGRAIET